MAWFFGKRDPKRRKTAGDGDEGESHRSPGLELVVQRLESHAAHSILDLGASTTENVEFFSRFAEDVMVVGLFQSCSDALGPSNQRSKPFRFDERASEALPKRDFRFAAVLLWDLLPYFDSATWEAFAQQLRRRLEPGALIYLLAANHAETSMVPMGFRVDPGRTLHGKLESCGLRYAPAEGDQTTELQMRTRDVEGRMQLFEPVRLFQLRNGFQEFVFRKPEGAEDELPPEPETTSVVVPASEPSTIDEGQGGTDPAEDRGPEVHGLEAHSEEPAELRHEPTPSDRPPEVEEGASSETETEAPEPGFSGAEAPEAASPEADSIESDSPATESAASDSPETDSTTSESPELLDATAGSSDDDGKTGPTTRRAVGVSTRTTSPTSPSKSRRKRRRKRR